MMLITNLTTIGEKLFSYRKRLGMTQAEVADAAGLSDRTYADIERGTANMRIETLLRICEALHITPDEALTEDAPTLTARQEEIWSRFESLSQKDRETPLLLLEVYLQSLA